MPLSKLLSAIARKASNRASELGAWPAPSIWFGVIAVAGQYDRGGWQLRRWLAPRNARLKEPRVAVLADNGAGPRLGSSCSTITKPVGWKVRLLTVCRFGLVGASGLLVNQGLLWVWVAGAHGHYVVGAVVATQGSTLWNFFLLERWVFLHAKARQPLVRLASFAIVNNSTLLLRIPLLLLLTSALRVHYLISNAITLLVLFALRFLLSDQFIWKESDLPTTASVARAALDGVDRESAVPGALAKTAPVPIPAASTPRRSTTGLSYTYDIGSLVVIASAVRLRELEYFRVPALERPADIEIRVRPVGTPGPRLRPLVTYGPTFVAYDEHLGRLGANFRLDFRDRIEVTIGPLLARSPHVLYCNVVEALLRFVLVSRDRILLHSATVELDGRGIMLTARTDTGKTGTVLRLLRERGALFLSDDMTIVEPGGLARCYPKPLTISAHTLQAVDRGSLQGRERLRLAVQSHVHSRRGRTIGSRLGEMNLPIMALNSVAQVIVPPPKYMADRLVRCRFASCAMVRELFVIERGPRAIEEVDLSRAVDILIENTDDAYGFPPFRYFAPAIAIDGQDYGRLRARERALLTSFLAGVRVRRVSRDDFGWADAIPRLLIASGESTT
jgi:dolichol-phosphate mannosyltransferase